MARRTATVRAAKWLARMQMEAISPIMLRKLEAASVRFIASAERAEAIEDNTKTVLNGAGAVPFALIPSYMAFAKQAGSLKDRLLGESLADEVAILTVKWVSRGLDEDVLLAIAGVV